MSSPITVVIRPAQPTVVAVKTGPQGPAGAIVGTVGTGFLFYNAGTLVGAQAVNPTVASDFTVGGANTVLTSNGTVGVWQTIVDANVANNAAIAVSKLAAGTNGYVLTMVAGVPTWQAGFTAGGDLSGTSTSQTVIKINGASVPVSGALTTGNVLQVNGVASLTYAALNLAGGANYVTGLLPLGNQAAPTGTGVALVSAGAWVGAAGTVDLSSNTYVSNTLAVGHGGTGLTALGSGLQVLRTNAGATAMEWWTPNAGTITGIASTGAGTGVVANGTSGANVQVKSLVAGTNVTITNGVNDITIAASGATTPTGTGFYHVTAGAMDTASKKVDLTASADVTVPGSNTHVVYSTGTALAANGNLTHDGSGNVVVANSVGVGATVASTSLFRVPWQPASGIMSMRNSGNTGDYNVITAAGSTFKFGDTTYGLTGNFYGYNVQILSGAGAVDLMPGSGNYGFGSDYTNAYNTSALQILGDTRANSPYGCHGDVTISATGGSTYTLAASEYSKTFLTINASGGASAATVDFPTPAAGRGYFRFVYTTWTYGVILRKAGGGGNTVSLSQDNACVVYVTSGGVYRMSANTAVTP